MAKSAVLPSQITTLAPHVYEVEGSTPGSIYTVNTTPGSPKTCTCTGYSTSRNRNKRDSGLIQGTAEYGAVEGSCRHLTAILAMEAPGKLREAAQQQERELHEQVTRQKQRRHRALLKDLEELEDLG